MSSGFIPAARDRVIVAHASDVHVDDSYTARLFGGDGAGGLRAVLEAAKRAEADVVLLAGDTFECHRLPDAIIERTAETISEFRLPVVILPGNHDPAIAEAVFHHPAFGAVAGLSILGVTHEEAVHFPHLDLEVWGRPHRDYHDMDPLAQVRARSTLWQIAMAHGHFEPVPDRSTRLRASWLIGDDEIAATGADYVALGHWNRNVRVGSSGIEAWYSGSPDYAQSINVVELGGNGGGDGSGGSVRVRRERLVLPEGFAMEGDGEEW